MNVGFIGAGKVGCSFGKYFQEHKIQVTGFYSKSEDSSLAASNFTSSKQYLNLRELVDENDTIFITTLMVKFRRYGKKLKIIKSKTN